eukprot:ANDGO_02324.mRNA.1 hypothetical protein
MSGTGGSLLDAIPVPLLLRIFSFLPPLENLHRLPQVCLTWYYLVSSDSCDFWWRKAYFDKWTPLQQDGSRLSADRLAYLDWRSSAQDARPALEQHLNDPGDHSEKDDDDVDMIHSRRIENGFRHPNFSQDMLFRYLFGQRSWTEFRIASHMCTTISHTMAFESKPWRCTFAGESALVYLRSSATLVSWNYKTMQINWRQRDIAHEFRATGNYIVERKNQFFIVRALDTGVKLLTFEGPIFLSSFVFDGRRLFCWQSQGLIMCVDVIALVDHFRNIQELKNSARIPGSRGAPVVGSQASLSSYHRSQLDADTPVNGSLFPPLFGSLADTVFRTNLQLAAQLQQQMPPQQIAMAQHPANLNESLASTEREFFASAGISAGASAQQPVLPVQEDSSSNVIYVIVATETTIPAIHSEGDYFVVSQGTRVCLYRWGFRAPVKTFLAHDETSILVCARFDENFVVAGCYHGVVYVWNRQTGDLLRRFRAHNTAVRGVFVCGRLIVTISTGERIRIHDIDAFRTITTFESIPAPVRNIEFVLDETWDPQFLLGKRSGEFRLVASFVDGYTAGMRTWDFSESACLSESSVVVLNGSENTAEEKQMRMSRLLLFMRKFEQKWLSTHRASGKSNASAGAVAAASSSDLAAGTFAPPAVIAENTVPAVLMDTTLIPVTDDRDQESGDVADFLGNDSDEDANHHLSNPDLQGDNDDDEDDDGNAGRRRRRHVPAFGHGTGAAQQGDHPMMMEIANNINGQATFAPIAAAVTAAPPPLANSRPAVIGMPPPFGGHPFPAMVAGQPSMMFPNPAMMTGLIPNSQGGIAATGMGFFVNGMRPPLFVGAPGALFVGQMPVQPQANGIPVAPPGAAPNAPIAGDRPHVSIVRQQQPWMTLHVSDVTILRNDRIQIHMLFWDPATSAQCELPPNRMAQDIVRYLNCRSFSPSSAISGIALLYAEERTPSDPVFRLTALTHEKLSLYFPFMDAAYFAFLSETATTYTPFMHKRLAIHDAALAGDLAMIQFLIQNGADACAIESVCGWTPAHILACMPSVDSAFLLSALRSAGAQMTIRDFLGNTVAHCAYLAGNKRFIKHFEESERGVLRIMNFESQTPKDVISAFQAS